MLKTPETEPLSEQEQLCYVRGKAHKIVEIWYSVSHKHAPPVVVVHKEDET